MSAVPTPAECSFLELPVQLDGAASLELIVSGTTHCFMQGSEVPNSCTMFEGSELKVQLAMGRKFRIKNKCLLPITFDPFMGHVSDCYVDKLTTPIILGIQWL